MAMSDAYRDEVRDAGAGAVSHFGLVDETGTELSGGDPAYARIADTPVSDGTGTWRPSQDLTFDIPAGTTVAGWRAFDASTGGTDWGGEDLPEETFNEQGQYTLLADQTAVHHEANSS